MIYFDNAATTPISKNVKNAIINALDIYGNPSSQYDIGKESKAIIEQSRHKIEDALGLPKNSIVFTSGGSEADNFALYAGWLYGKRRGRNKVVISSVEHHAIGHAAEQLRLLGAEIVVIDVDGCGSLDLEQLKNSVDYNTAIVSIMASNNETGTTSDIFFVSEIAHKHGALFHTDAVQGITYMNIPANVVDMMSLSGHKYGAPKGIGALYINPFMMPEIKGYELISGGKQEFGLRGGTENIPYIVGFAQATVDLVKTKEEKIERETRLHNYLLGKLKQDFPYIKINGYESAKHKNPGILNFSLGFADAASVVEWMNIYEICISSGSACNTGSNKPSHVLTAMGMDEQRAFSSVRVSLSELNDEKEIDRFIEVLKDFEKVYKH